MAIDGRTDGRQPDWVSIHEAARLIGVSPATLRRWSDAGDIRAFTTPGGHRRFSRSAIVGLLPAGGEARPSRDELTAIRRRVIRRVRWTASRIVRDAPWREALDADDRATLDALGWRMIDGILDVLDPPGSGDPRAAAAGARSAAMACGERIGRRGVGLRPTIDAGIRLRTLIVHDLAAAARDLDVDAATTSRWLEIATCGLDDLLAAAMRGHEATATASLGGDRPSAVRAEGAGRMRSAPT